MKNLLAILGAAGVFSTASTSVVACGTAWGGNGSGGETKPEEQQLKLDKNVIELKEQTSSKVTFTSGNLNNLTFSFLEDNHKLYVDYKLDKINKKLTIKAKELVSAEKN